MWFGTYEAGLKLIGDWLEASARSPPLYVHMISGALAGVAYWTLCAVSPLPLCPSICLPSCAPVFECVYVCVRAGAERQAGRTPSTW